MLIKYLNYLFSFIAFLFFCQHGNAQSGAYKSTQEKKVRILPFPDFGYAPETRWYVGGVALFAVRFFDDTLSRKSNFKAEINFTQNHQFVGTLKHEAYLKDNSYAIIGENTFYYYPEFYWG